MVATKNKVNLQEIADDIRARYQSGESTQAELAESFHVTASAINRLVKGVKPEKRKYRRNEEKIQRNEQIVEAYNAGSEVKDLAAKYEMTHQNVSLILKEAGITPQSSYISKLKEQGAATKARLAAEKEQKKQAKIDAVEQLSALWSGGCSIEEFRAAAGLKTVNSAQVKLVLLRKKYGEEKFPRRNRKAGTVETVEAPEVVEEVEQEQVVDEFVAQVEAENEVEV